MRKIIWIIIIILSLAYPVSAVDLSAPEVFDDAKAFMPKEQENLMQGILEVLKDCACYFRPDLKEAAKSCYGVILICIVFSILQSIPESNKVGIMIAGTCSISLVLLQSANSLIQLGLKTISEISEYAKMFFPVMAAALAAQGGVSASTQIYAGTVIFNTILCNIVSSLLHPAIYLFLFSSVASSAIEEKILSSLKDIIKGCITWVNKTIIYVFTGYMGITGVISGTTDTAALKAAKLAISGVIPVVGNILSDASEAVMVSAATVKNSIGIYGFFAVLAIWLRPFLRIGAHYMALKLTGGLCSMIDGGKLSSLITSFSEAMGLILGMTGATCLMLIISIVCFMKGMG